MVLRILYEKPAVEKLQQMGVMNWPIWQAEPSTFPWHYDEQEVCYFLAGRVVVKTADQTVHIGKGDLVTFPAGLDCEWQVIEAVRKHYRFGK